jgi:ribosomal protein S14
MKNELFPNSKEHKAQYKNVNKCFECGADHIIHREFIKRCKYCGHTTFIFRKRGDDIFVNHKLDLDKYFWNENSFW